MALMTTSQTEPEILEISHLATHKTPFSVQSRGQWRNFPKCHDFNNQLRCIYVVLMVDLDDNWPEMDFYHYGPCIVT